MKRVLVFGVFDGVHEGHRDFLRQARKLGDYLVACVARDEVVLFLKNKNPSKELRIRKQELRETGLVDDAVEGDAEIGIWEVIGKAKPDVIALGYDQVDLKAVLEVYARENGLQIEIRVMKAHKPEKYHSSLLQG